MLLYARIEAVVRRYQANTNELTAANVTLDLANRKSTTPRGDLFLTGKEFDLLRHLILHKGAIVSKEEISKSVWDLKSTPTTNVIEVTVKNLRKKLEEKTGKNLIKSIYGEGYIFIAE